jgi:hypothetical protein
MKQDTPKPVKANKRIKAPEPTTLIQLAGLYLTIEGLGSMVYVINFG